MRSTALLVLLLVIPALARAQDGVPADAPAPQEAPPEQWAPPPLVDAPTSTPPTADAPAQTAPTPPPPGYMPGAGNQVPYPYSPYGQTAPPEAPGPEIGLMISEVAFGTLTAAASGLLVYFLAVRPLVQNPEAVGLPSYVGELLFVLTFTSVPMAVAQTQVNIANGSRYYVAENWPALLSGLATEAALLGMFFLLRQANNWQLAELLLLSGTVIGVPLVEMAVINLTKTPRWKVPVGAYGAVIGYDEKRGLTGGIPIPQVVPVTTSRGMDVGFGLSLAAGRF